MRYYEILRESNSNILFHASPASVTSFAPLSHFGTREAALHRAGNAVYQNQPMKLYEVNLISTNPLRVPDLTSKVRSANHTWSNLTDMLHYKVKKISASERDSIYQAGGGIDAKNATAGTRKLIDVLQAHGWDALVYQNVFEDVGSQSWINLTGEQCHIVRAEEIMPP